MITILLTTGVSLQNCNDPLGFGSSDGLDCSACPPFIGDYFDVEGLGIVMNISREGDSRKAINRGDTISFDNFERFWLQFEVNYLASSCISPRSRGFSLMNSAYACSCLNNGELGSKDEKLEAFTVVTLNDFNDTYKAGDTINNLVVVQLSDEEFPLDNYILQDTSLLSYEWMYLGLLQAPTSDQPLALEFSADLSTGEHYAIESEPFWME